MVLYVLDFCVGCLNKIELTDEEAKDYEENYSGDLEAFVDKIDERYGFRAKDSQWMLADEPYEYEYRDGKLVEFD